MTQATSCNNQHGSNPADWGKSDMKQLQAVDVGPTILNGTVDNLQVQSDEDRRVLRKIDTFLLPILAFTYMIQVS